MQQTGWGVISQAKVYLLQYKLVDKEMLKREKITHKF